MKQQPSTLPEIDKIEETWYVVDAAGMVVGRVASRVAKVLRGKTSPHYAPHINPKTHVVILNASKVLFTGKKLTDKIYRHHTMWRTGVKEEAAGKLLQRAPEEVLRRAIHGMLPKGRIGSKLNKNLRIYAGAEHPHEAQQPKPLVFKTRVPRRKA